MALQASRLAAELLRVLPRKRLSRVLGRAADLTGPSRLLDQAISTYIRLYGVDMSEAVVPPDGFLSFDDFFTRKLIPGARPIDSDERAIVSPADGRIEDIGEIDARTAFRIKGCEYDLGELLGDPAAAEPFRNGIFFIVYLSPRDYHRVHAPVSGLVCCIRHVPGTLYPVNSIGLQYVPRLFARNERVAVFQDLDRHRQVATVLVGAIGVGRISLSFDDIRTNSGRPAGVKRYKGAEPNLKRGDELGVFHLGSTAIVFIAPGFQPTIVRQPGDVVRVGEAVVRWGSE